MNILIVGFGSIGQRHARILDSPSNIISLVTRRTDTPYQTFASIPDALASRAFDYVLICNETHNHQFSLSDLEQLKYAGPVFIEKPIFSCLPHKSFRPPFRVCVGYVLRFHPLIASVKSILAGSVVYSAYSYCGQYLPDWRPNRDYRNSYSAHAEGGGVLLDLSHEIDYIQFLFGGLTLHSSVVAKLSPLEIEAEDTVSFLASTPLCPHVSVGLNYLDSVRQRFLVVHGSFGSIKADFVSNTLLHNQSLTSYEVNMDELFFLQHSNFLKPSGNPQIYCDLADSMNVLSFVEKVKQASDFSV